MCSLRSRRCAGSMKAEFGQGASRDPLRLRHRAGDRRAQELGRGGRCALCHPFPSSVSSVPWRRRLLSCSDPAARAASSSVSGRAPAPRWSRSERAAASPLQTVPGRDERRDPLPPTLFNLRTPGAQRGGDGWQWLCGC